MKKLPRGIPTFPEIIEEDYIYIDKTKYLYEMINTGKIYFLSRPRRFGKSMIVSTLDALFSGKKELFKGLFIQDKWNWDETFPVIRLSFGTRGHNNPEKLERSLHNFLKKVGKRYNIKLEDTDILSDKFEELLEMIYEKTGKKVVILIDEYDKPIINHLNNLEIADKNRLVLREFYQVLKENDCYIKFLFITGVTKFAKTSIFSDLNQLSDITMEENYANICGYTQEDLEYYFKDYIDKLSKTTGMTKEEALLGIKNCYNGYSWNGKNFLYNPISILNLFAKGKFSNYWVDTGTPKFLVDLIKTNNVNLEVLAKKGFEFKGEFPNFDIDKIDFSTVLLQTGYLTIKNEELRSPKAPIYTTGIPNKEVEDSLFKYLLASLTNNEYNDIEPLTKDILEAIISEDSEILTEKFESIVHKLPNLIYGNIKSNFEDFLKSIIILSIHMMGFNIEAEVLTLKGRLDALLTYKDSVVIFEFKFSESESAETLLSQANNQIIEKGYYKPYINKNPSIVTVAIKSREEVSCKFQSLKETIKQYENK